MGSENGTYRGLPGALRFSFRRSDSRVFKSYVIIGGLVAAFIAILLLFGLVGVVAETLGASELVTPVRSFYLLIGILLVAPILAPVLLVARRHRRATSTPEYDARLALGGYLFIGAVYVGLVISTPPGQQVQVEGPHGPVVSVLYGIPAILGLLPPIAAAVGIWAIHRRYS